MHIAGVSQCNRHVLWYAVLVLYCTAVLAFAGAYANDAGQGNMCCAVLFQVMLSHAAQPAAVKYMNWRVKMCRWKYQNGMCKPPGLLHLTPSGQRLIRGHSTQQSWRIRRPSTPLTLLTVSALTEQVCYLGRSIYL